MYCFTFFPCYSDQLFFCFFRSDAGIFSSFFHFFHCCFCFWYVQCFSLTNKSCWRFLWISELLLFPVIWRSWFLCKVSSTHILVDSSTSTMYAYFVLQMHGTSQITLYSRPLMGSELPTFSVFLIVSSIFYLLDQCSKYLVIFLRCQASVFQESTFTSLFVSALLTCHPIFLVTENLVWMSLTFLSVAPWIM